MGNDEIEELDIDLPEKEEVKVEEPEIIEVKEETKKDKKKAKKEAKKEQKKLKKEEKKQKKDNKPKKKIKVNKKALLIIGLALLGILLIYLIIHFLVFPQIYLTGGKSININYKDEFKDPGYKANYLGTNLTKKVKVSGLDKVDTSKLGTYKVTYSVEGGLLKKTVVRNVNVKDLKKPKLSIDNSDAYVCPGTEYKKEDVTATDNYDGDITKKIKVDITKTQVTYSVADTSGNKKSVTKKLIYKDIEKPVITLSGNETVEMCTNEVYKDPGYSANDNCDGEIKDVEVEGSVDNSLVGEYTIKYSAKDKAGNVGTAERKVNVSDSDSDGVVYLTFDDGPNEGTTDVILDILKEEGVQATFFVTLAGPDYLIEREYNEGHTVALHTASHEYSIVYASDDAYYDDLQQVADRVKRLTGVDSKFIRFPGGSSNTVSRHYSSGIMTRLTQSVQERGYKYFDWNISSGDAEGGTPPASKIYNNVVSNLRKDRVNMVLMHDIKWYTRDALRDIIRYCKDNGYQMKKITNCTTMITQRVGN